MKFKTTLMAVAAVIAIVSIGYCGEAKEERKSLNAPTWEELTELLGKDIKSDKFKAFIKKYEMSSFGGPRGTDSFGPKKTGFSVYTSDKGIVILVLIQDGYTKKLPYGLKWKMNLGQIQKILGAPDNKEKPNDKLTKLEYFDKHLRIFVSISEIWSIQKKIKMKSNKKDSSNSDSAAAKPE